MRSRVSRRIAILFLIAALLPTSLLAILTYRNVTQLMQEQLRSELVESSRAYAMAMLGRLGLARSVLENIAPGSQRGASSVRLPMFDAIDHIDTGDAQANRKHPAAQYLSDAQLKEIHTAKIPVLTIVPANAAAETALVFLSLPVHGERDGVLLARISPSYLWGERDDVSAAYNICVYGKNIRLYCGYPDEAQIKAGSALTQDGQWQLFLTSEFRADPWTIVTARRFSPGKAALSEFFNVYLGVAVLSVLLIMLLSLVQIRRTMVPLEKLIDGAKRIAAGDYREISVDSQDEFGDLSAAVNKMSSRIEWQLNTLQTLSAIDHEMRDQLNLPRLISMVAAAMRSIVPGATLYVARQAPNEFESGRLFVQKGEDAPLTEDDVRISDREIALLAEHANGVMNRPPPPFPGLAAGEAGWSIALLWHGRGCGMLSLAWQGAASLEQESLAGLTELANRIAVAIQIQEREQRLLYQALYDSLTGLLNRHGVEERIAQITATDTPAAVLYVDIDRFKLINDNFGHKMGDLLLQVIAARLREATTGIAGRLGGDEFILLLPGEDCAEKVAATAYMLMELLTRPFAISSEQFLLTCSIGIALHPAEINDGLTLIERADIAMYRAKQSGRNAYRFYDAAMNVENHRRLELEADLRLALKRDEFLLHYQPKVSLKTGEILGAEALVRWRHPTAGLIPPLQFIGLAEETGLIVPLGTWVMRVACAQALLWNRAGIKPVSIAVNVSARQFAEPGFVDVVADILRDTGLPGTCLEIEITESMIMNDVEHAISIFHALRKLGVVFSIDDFGTGYSSLSYLKRFPISVLKIDQSFVRDIEHDQGNRSIVASIIGLAHNLQLQVLAEGVETVAQLDYLQQQGCDEIQGYYFSHPIEASQFSSMLAEDKRLALSLPLRSSGDDKALPAN
ncbi:bifunctional diguanylate cyclase/phosphodiesterase [Herminiimonas sp.]|uniref:putative bifunctional diguanylate cyclase/phosphodiesterase n=1 Tax=Herminiimonas sp. TaxID=1926289 RepID=UPI002729EBA4|nr:EAL domain-containing protein [Herminiimonas sp.]